MPNKYSHGLVFSQDQYRGATNLDRPPPPKIASSHTPRSHAHSASSSIYTLPDRSTRGSVNLDYTRLDPNLDSAPSYSYRSAPHTRRPSFNSTPSDPPPLHSTSSKPPRPPSGRLRLESPLGFRWENPPSSPQKIEPEFEERSYYDIPSSHLESSPLGRLRLGDPSPHRSRSPRPSLHHSSSSLETQIYAPDPIQQGPNLSSTKANEPNSLRGSIDERQDHSPAPTIYERRDYTSPTSTHERQHVFSLESPETASHPSSVGDREGRLSSDTQRTYLPSPTRSHRQSFVQQTQASASPPPVQSHLANSLSGTQNPSLSSSARDLHTHTSAEMRDSQSTPAAVRDRQDASTLKALPALPVPNQTELVRPSLDIQRVQSPPRTREVSRRPSLETQHVSFDHRAQSMQKSGHSRQQSSDSQTTRNRQDLSSLDARCSSSDWSVKEIPGSGRQPIKSKIPQERQPYPSSSSQQLSLEQFIQESERIHEPSIESQMYSPQRSISNAGNTRSHQSPLANEQRNTPKNTIPEHGPQSRRDRPSKLSDTFASQHRILLPAGQDDYDNALIETQGFPPERPPSPPATPKSKKSFLLASKVEDSQRARPPPPIPQRSAWRSPSRQRSILNSANASVDKLPLEPPRPKTSSSVDGPTNLSKATTLHSPTLSISTRKSSINATTSPPFVPFSDFSETMTSPPRKSLNQSRDDGYFNDADLEPLPSDVDYNVLPFENPNAGPAIFRATQLGLENPVSPRYEGPNARAASIRATQLGTSFSHRSSVSSDASSFDSAAPPPIGLNRRITHATTEPHPKPPKKESKLSLLSFLRSSTAPKAILYSEARQGTPPVRVSLSKDRHNGLRPRPEPRMRPSLDTRRSARRSPAHIDAAEKRKSWYMGDDVEQIRAAIRMEKKREFERILNNI